MSIPDDINQSVKSLSSFSDHRGCLTVVQDEIPFTVKRAYWIEASKGSVRGCHRHIETHQCFSVLTGAVLFHLEDEHDTRHIELRKSSELLYLSPEIWHKLEFLEDSIVLAFASHSFSEADYINEAYHR